MNSIRFLRPAFALAFLLSPLGGEVIAGDEGGGKVPSQAVPTSRLPESEIGVALRNIDPTGKWVLANRWQGGGYLEETWRWESEQDGQADFSIQAVYKRQSPAPPVSEVARAFSRAASRASYASTVIDSEISPTEQWVDYTLPLQGEGGFKKIVAVRDGYVTLTLANSDKFEAEEGSPERRAWDKMVEALRGASIVPE